MNVCLSASFDNEVFAEIQGGRLLGSTETKGFNGLGVFGLVVLA